MAGVVHLQILRLKWELAHRIVGQWNIWKIGVALDHIADE